MSLVTIKCSLTLKQVEEQHGRLKVTARAPSTGQVLCNHMHVVAVSSMGDKLQVMLVRSVVLLCFNSLKVAMC